MSFIYTYTYVYRGLNGAVYVNTSNPFSFACHRSTLSVKMDDVTDVDSFHNRISRQPIQYVCL
jgi:hypothetical protein